MNAMMGGLQNIALNLSRYSDIVLAFLLVGIISLMILPIPMALMDGMIAINLGCSVSLLMVSLYIPSALSLSTFPTLLLFTTLFRLALNITTTRQILLHAYAGEIILTFGNLVVGGNFIVGAVIFLIITIVQFIVIAKGSERVAEVGARFTLDAMPGKQMSIDADLRAGIIDMNEAKRRRVNIENESKLFGAMDGAMKFVKGDAIAGLIVTVVNIIGGMSIGVLQKGMQAAEALQKYTILTIGDGLVSQIPALFISITAGIIITRVNASDEDENLGGQIGKQLLGQPKGLYLAGFILFGLALIPGFPKIQFILLGLVIGGIGFVLYQFATRVEDGEHKIYSTLSIEDSEVNLEADFSLTVPLLIDLSPSIKTSIEPEQLNQMLKFVERSFYHEFGVPLPGINIRFNERLPGNTYFFLIQEIPMYNGVMPAAKLMVRERPEILQANNIPFVEGTPITPNLPALWVDEKMKPILKKKKFSFCDQATVITDHFSYILQKHATDFINFSETKQLLDKMEQHFPELVREVTQILSVQAISEVLQLLVEEGISIRNLKTILQSLVEWGQKEKDVIQLAEYSRVNLKRYICYKYTSGRNVLKVLLLDPDLEDVIQNAIRQTTSGIYLSLEPDVTKTIIDKLKNEIEKADKSENFPVVLTTMGLRRHLRNLLAIELPILPVLSYQELISDIKIQPISKISL